MSEDGAIVFFMVVFLVAGIALGATIATKNAHQDAVDNGVAKFVVDNKGKVSFQWVTNAVQVAQ